MAVEIPSWMQVENDGWDTETIEETPGYDFYDKTIKIFFEPGPHIYYRFDEEGNRVNIDGVTTILDIVNKPFLKPWAAKVAIEYVKAQMLLPDGSFKQFYTEEFMAMLEEAKGQHKVHLDKAADIGHIAHESLEKTIQYAIDNTGGVVLELKAIPSDDTPQHEMARSCMNAAWDWMKAHNVRWTATERKVYSKEYDFSGTEDGLCIVDSCTNLKCCGDRVFRNRVSVGDFKSSNQLSETYPLQVAAYQFAEIEEFGEPLTDRWVLRLGKERGEVEPWYLPSDEFEDDFEAFLAARNLYRGLKKVNGRRSAEKARIRVIIKAQKDAAKAIQDAQEREERRLAREASKLATQTRNEAKDAHYRTLRSSGMSPSDAKADVALKFPKPVKSESDDEVENQSSQSKTKLDSIVKVEKDEPFGIEWVLNL
jgi:hypothetical protein